MACLNNMIRNLKSQKNIFVAGSTALFIIAGLALQVVYDGTVPGEMMNAYAAVGIILIASILALELHDYRVAKKKNQGQGATKNP